MIQWLSFETVEGLHVQLVKHDKIAYALLKTIHSFVTNVKHGRFNETLDKSHGKLVKHNPKAHASLIYL
jgi:hypothetical protein